MSPKLDLSMQPYQVEVIKEAGVSPITHQPTPAQSERFQVEADSLDDAYRASFAKCSLRFMGETRRTFIDGEEYLSSRF